MKILLLGYFGQLGWELQRTLPSLGELQALDYPQIDLTKPESIRPVIAAFCKSAGKDLCFIVNATAYTAVDKAESEQNYAFSINGQAPGVMAEEAARFGAVLVHFSTDYVFDGKKGSPNLENDPVNPLNIYGRSKLEGEQAVSAAGGTFLIFRTSWVYSLRRESFVTKVLQWSRQPKPLRLVTDQVSNPTWARSLAEVTSQVVAMSIAQANPRDWLGEHSGLYHLAGSGFASRFEWGKAILRFDPHPEEQLTQDLLPALSADFPTPAQRPVFSALNCELFTRTFGIRLPDWEPTLKLALQEQGQQAATGLAPKPEPAGTPIPATTPSRPQ